MYDFKKHLIENKTILYEGRPNPGKGAKEIAGALFIIVFFLLLIAALIWSVITKTGDGANGINLEFIILFLTMMFFLGIGTWSLIYDLFLKYLLLMTIIVWLI